MGLITFKIDDSQVEARLRAFDLAMQDMTPAFSAIGRVLLNRIRICFKFGIDPWGKPWPAIKWRAPRSRMVAVKDKSGNVVDYKRKFGKDGKLLLTKTGQQQVLANKAGKPGQPLRDTGRLNRSISSRPDAQGVTVGTNVVYARIHQFGGIIKAKNKPLLAFPGPGGEIIFAKRVTIPARPYLPIRKGSNDAVLPGPWANDATRALRTYFQRVL